MKKLLLLSALLIFACSSDDSTSDDSTSIEGRWNLDYYTDCGTPDPTMSTCELSSYIIFNNGSGELIGYSDDEGFTDCLPEEAIELTYDTMPNNPNTYIVVFDSLDGFETATGTVNGNTLTFINDEYNAIDSGCPQQEGTIIEVITFTRN